MWIADKWTDYRLLDSADGEKIELWGNILLRRPEPQAIWTKRFDKKLWEKADAVYHRSKTGGGSWEFRKKLPPAWKISYGKLVFNIKPMGFKHTGLFPEQAVNWDWFCDLIKNAQRPVKVLNLFAYTGGATVAALSAGAEVVHVDASRGMVAWAKENAAASGLDTLPVRYIVDDVVKFVKREARRNNRYDAVIMDPPSYGRGPGKEVWKIENELYPLVLDCMEILSEKPLFFLINSYTTGFGASVVANILKYTLCEKFGGSVEADEIGLLMSASNMPLPCGVSGRWRGDSIC